MAKLSSYRRLFGQDYPENRDLIDQIGTPINASFEEIYSALNNRLTFRENISATIVEFGVTVDSNGYPKNDTQFKLSNGQTTVEGLIVINVTGSKDPSLLTSGGVNVKFKRNENFIIVQNVQGLQADKPYTIKAICLG